MRPILLPARNASPWTGPTGNNTYLLTGRVTALVDAGVGNADHLEEISRAIGAEPLQVVLLTHGHVDHTAGVPALQARWPSVRIVRFDGAVASIAAGDTVLRPIHTPGHAPDHLCFLDDASGDLFCGDLVRADGTIVIPASKGGHLGQYLSSLRLVRDLKPARLLPAHGPVIGNPTQVIDHYLHHRAQREAQVIEALLAGADTPEKIVARVYPRLPDVILGAAADSVLAHLVKLEEEGRAVRVRRASDDPHASPPVAWHLV